MGEETENLTGGSGDKLFGCRVPAFQKTTRLVVFCQSGRQSAELTVTFAKRTTVASFLAHFSC
jgi:hypothetical protein